MTNPWLKTNPFLSLWLSWLNTVGNTMRAHALTQGRRQTHAAASRVGQTFIDGWLTLPTSSPGTKRRRPKSSAPRSRKRSR